MEGIIAESYSTEAAGDEALPGAQAFGRKREMGPALQMHAKSGNAVPKK